MPKVYVPNKGGHDYSDAERYGDLVYVTTGEVNKYALTTQYRKWQEVLKESQRDDKILMCSLTTLCAIGASLFALQHKRLNFLLWRKDRYMERTIVLED